MKTREQIESIRRGRRRMKETLILLTLLVLLIAASVIVYFAVSRDTGTGDDTVKKDPPEIIDGEAIYRNTAIAYPNVSASDITRITVSNNNKNGQYTLVRDELADGSFLFTYMEDGKVRIFYPEICSLDENFKYTDLYAKEVSNNYSIPKITYLTSGLEVPYFGERIPLPEGDSEREAALAEYGFGKDKETTVIFDYEDGDGKTVTHKIVIGDKTVTGTGYYFTVDDRPYVYNSLSNYYEYALAGFYSFVNSALIAKGLEQDSTLEPIYTTDFTQWKTELYEKEGTVVPEKSEVIISANLFTPVSPSDYFASPESFKDSVGYSETGFEDMTVNLYGTAEKRMKDALVGKTVGIYYDPADASANKTLGISLTLPSDFSEARLIDFGTHSSVKYTYEITEIEAIVAEGDDITAAGTPVGDNDVIRVAYRYTVNGKEGSPILSHAVMNLTDAALSGVAAKIRTLTVGKLDTPLTFGINYTAENAVKTDLKIKITEIIEIFKQDGKSDSQVREDSLVTYRYFPIINGTLADTEYIGYINLKEDTDKSSLAIKEKILGKQVSRSLSIVVDAGTEYCEVMRDFKTYEISAIKYFVTKEEVVSFGFLSYSERDPFYGDSIYENRTDGYLLYGLNNSVCDHILKLLGGIGDNASMSLGLEGMETVDAGITPEKLRERKLYEHRIRFVLPRELVAIDSGREDVIDDYTSYNKLPFTLYISDILDDGTRYVASDLFDVIVKVSNDYFFFVDDTFINFWARENLIMTDVTYMQDIKIEFNLTDLVGKYDIDLIHKESYLTSTGLQVGGTPPQSYYDTFDYVTVNVKPVVEEGESVADVLADKSRFTPNALTELIRTSDGRKYVDLTELYKATNDPDRHQAYFPDSLGTTYFKEFIRSMFYISYEGAVDESEQADIIANSPMVMKFAIKIDTDKDGDDKDEDYYTYEFYRCADRRVLVRLYEADDEGNATTPEVSDFYISTYGFKRIAATFTEMLNGVEFDVEEGYPD